MHAVPRDSKVMSLADAVRAFVPDGSSVVAGVCLEQRIPFAAGHEIIRQGKRDLTLVGPISDILFDQLIGAGCVARVAAAWVGNVTAGTGYNFRRAVEQGIPRPLEVIDYTNLTLALALHAAALGVPFLPTRSALGSDVQAGNPHLVPFTSPVGDDEPLVAVRALHPDVAIVHADFADASGNGALRGNLGLTGDAVAAAARCILLAEEIVPAEVLQRDPNRVVIPGYRVDAVCCVPYGCHPSPVFGRYDRDHPWFADYHRRTRTEAGFTAWLDEWVRGVPDWSAYLERVGRDRPAALSRGENRP